MAKKIAKSSSGTKTSGKSTAAKSAKTPAKISKGKNGSRLEAKSEAPKIIMPVATNGKQQKNQAGMNARELDHFRDLLLAKRRELLGDVRDMESEALRSSTGSNLSNMPVHMADMGTDNYEQEFTLGLVEKDRNLVREINTALAKIMNGTFGLCEGSGKPIGKARLEAQPWAKHSIEWARELEKKHRGH